MARKNNRNASSRPKGNASRSAAVRPPLVIPAKKAPIQYGKAFVLLEDQQKNTFAYTHGKWSPHPMNIAQWQLSCSVTELPQKLNGMTRYEIRCPLPADD
jgi:hypothetical protein